jgi:hypothetical protein
VGFATDGDRSVTVHGYVSVPPGQVWFFTPERLAGKRETVEEIAMSRGTAHVSGEAMFVYLEILGASDD